MTGTTDELMFELLKKMNSDLSSVKTTVGELKVEMNAMRGTMVSMQADTHNIYGILARHDERFDRIEKRLDLRELAEAQRRYDPGE